MDQDRQVGEEPEAVDFMKVSQMEVTMTRQQMLAAFYELEKTRLRQIEQLIPHFQQLRHNHKDKQGQTLTYYSGMVEGCSIGHLVPSYFYDGFF